MWHRITAALGERWESLQDFVGGRHIARIIGVVVALYLVVTIILGMYWSSEPPLFSVQKVAADMAQQNNRKVVIGFTTTATLIHMGDVLLTKPGGYLSNDIFPPGVWLDNMPNWEYGVLVQMRDMARALRRDMSRSQSQSAEDKDLTVAEPQLNFDNNSWAIPSTEGEYRRGLRALRGYLLRLSDPKQPQAQFYARSDNLNAWLGDVQSRLGSLSRRLSQSVGNVELNAAMKGDKGARQSTEQPASEYVQTPWTKIDDVFYEARGQSWALIELLEAAEVDFHGVLVDKNALVSFQQIILELKATQEPIWSPMILNGSGFGVLANHSLTMASYLSRANAAIIDLRSLLAQG
ncbi:DUF2333 family protein [Mangrovitalea sediminis]|uniref:DUF2333 family protein n=1 Tax=Mangrovitalea sediminis TaxID=1982043 RepID=UPI000BE5D6EB|nr:DUF2333 family protein [Mangrovitalea sediminis]